MKWQGKNPGEKVYPTRATIDSLLWDEVCSSNLTEVSNYFLVFSIISVQLTKQPGRVLCQKLIAAHFDIGESGTYSVQQFIYFPIFPNNYEQNIHYAFWIKKWKGKIFQTWLNRHFFFTRLHKYLIDQSYGYNVDHEMFKSYFCNSTGILTSGRYRTVFMCLFVW